MLNRAANRLELLGDALFDYRDVLHAGDPELLRRAWQRVAETGLPFHLAGLESDNARERWPEFSTRPFARAPEVNAISEAQFRMAHPRLGRQWRRLQRKGVSLDTGTGGDSALVRHLYQRKCGQFADECSNLFRDPLRREFMVAVAAAEGKRCEIFFLRTGDGTLVAGLVSFRDEQIRRFYTIYFDPAWAHYSPGVVLLYEVTARTLAQGLGCDYMTGEYPYKMRLATSSRPLYQVNVSASELTEIAVHEISRVA